MDIQIKKGLFTDGSKALRLLWINLLFMLCVCHAFLSFHCSLVVTCWERADLLARLHLKFSCVLSLSHVVYCVVLDFIDS